MGSTRFLSGTAVAAAVGLLLGACGGGMGSPAAPSSPSSSGSVTATSGATVTISASGQVSPPSVTIAVGQVVTFVNNDSRAHEIASNPHPLHTDCPPINAVGSIGPGQTKMTDTFGAAVSCGYHDHQDPSNTNLQGQILVR